MKSSGKLTRRAVLILLVLAALKAINAPAGKALVSDLSPVFASGLRLLTGTLILYAWLRLRRYQFTNPLRATRLVAIVPIIYATNMLLLYIGLYYTTAVRAVIIINLQPLFVVLLAHFARSDDSLSGRKILGMILAFAGVVYLITDRESSAGFATLTGDLCMIGAVLLWAVSALIAKKVTEAVPSHVYVVFSAGIAGMILLVLGLLIQPDPGQFQLRSALSFAYLVTLGFGFLFFYDVKVIKAHKVTATQSFNFLIPIIGVIGSVILLNEPVSQRLLLSMLIVPIGIYLITHDGGGRAPTLTSMDSSDRHAEDDTRCS